MAERGPYRSAWLNVSWASGRRDKRQGKVMADLKQKSPMYAAAYLRGYLGGKPAPFPPEWSKRWGLVRD